MGQIVFHVVLIGIMGIFLKESFAINISRMNDPIGAAGFPRIIMILALVLLVISLINVIRKNKGKLYKGEKVQELNPTFLSLIGSIVLYILLIRYIGFLISSFILIGAILYILGHRKVISGLLISVIAAFGYTIVFGRLLSVPLPRGIAVFKIMSYFLY